MTKYENYLGAESNKPGEDGEDGDRVSRGVSHGVPP